MSFTCLLFVPVNLSHLISAKTLIMGYLLCGVRRAYVTPFWMHSHNQGTLRIETRIQNIPTDDL